LSTSHFRAARALALALGFGLAAPPGATAQDDPDSLATRIYPFPFVFYQPETKLGGGLGVLTTYRTAPRTRPSSINTIGVYTVRRQFALLVQAEHWAPRNEWRIGGEGSFSRFPDIFYGVGNSTRSEDDENFTLQHQTVMLDVRRRLRPELYAGLLAGMQHSSPRRIESGGLLDGGTISGAGGGTVTHLGAVAARDTRDNTFAGTRGSYATLFVRRAMGSLGDYSFTRIDGDLRGYASSGAHTLALHLVATSQSGEPPFYNLATLGGSSVLRGYYEGRYRDRNRVVAQAEWRFPVRRRVSGVVFAGAGEVMRDWRDFALRELHPSFGGGVRFRLTPAERINLRIDYAAGRGSSGLYFALGEAF
jgi:hypothetical protein